MTFLNPTFWWFALAIAVPIIVHLFNFRKPKRLLFPNLSFIKEVNKTVLRRVKLKQWLLLLVRILVIICLVAAFANPVIQKDGMTTSAGAKSVVVLVDNSYSMSGADDKGVYLQQAKILAQELTQSYGMSDEFQIQTTNNLKLNSPFTARAQALERIKEIDFKDKVTGYGKILSGIKDIFSESRNAQNLFYFLSDYQTATVMNDSIKKLDIPSNVQVIFAPIGNQKQVNVFISDVTFHQAIIEKGKPVTLSLRVNNDSEKEIENLSIKVNAEGKAVAVASVSLQANESKVTEVTFTPQKGGWQNGSISIDDMPINFDNTRYFSYYIPENTKVLLVYGNQSTQYLDMLFKNLVSQYKTETISEGDLSRASLGDYTTVVLAGMNNISSGLSDRLKSWVNEGGGLMFFPNPNMDVTSINNFYQNIGLGKFNNIINYTQPTQFAVPDLSHPIFETVFIKSKKNAEFDSPSISKIYDFQPFETGIQSTVIKDKNNKIALHEAKVGGGNVLTFGIYPSLEWSDFPLKSSFVPILYRGTLLLSNAAKSDFFQTIGNYKIKKIKTTSKELVKVRESKGSQKSNELIPEQFSQSGNMNLKFDRMDPKAGNYDVIQGDTVIEKISFNYPDAESKLSALDKSSLTTFLDGKNLSQVKVMEATAERVRNEVQGNVGGIPLWKYFIIAALLFVIFEIVILKTFRES